MFNALLPHFIVIAILLLVLAILVIGKVCYTHIVSEGYAGLLYHQGKFVRVVAPGRHVHWGRHFTLRWVDVRRASLLVAGQDVLTADSVGLKLSLLVTYQVVDPIKATHDTQNWQSDLHTSLSSPCVLSWERLPSNHCSVSDSKSARNLCRACNPRRRRSDQRPAVEVKDVMFPADLKRAFAEVLKAKQEGQAALERARGESAALRNLANAARVLEGNPALMNLRLLQSLSAAQNAGGTLVLGVPGFVPLKNGQQPNREESDAAS